MQITFELRHAYEGYRDYEYTLEDNPEGIGGYIQITLVDGLGLQGDEKPYAYGVIRFDTQEGSEVAHADFAITRAQAERVLGASLLSLPVWGC